MFLTVRILYIVSLITNVIYALQLNDLQDERRKRFKREDENVDILSNEYSRKYPFIVRIKTEQLKSLKRKSKITVICTGTLLNDNMVLTTAYCVKNAVSIKVMVIENSEENKLNYEELDIEIVPISSAKNIIENVGDRKILPNPLFYGDRISKNNEWYNPYPRNIDIVLNMPEKNLAMIYLNRSYSDIHSTDIIYPVIVAKPTTFVGPFRLTYLIKWNVEKNNNTSVLKMIKVDFLAGRCSYIDVLLANSICVDLELYRKTIVEGDQGAPIALYENKNTTDVQSNMSLVAMINTPRTDGFLIYLWPHMEWIISVMNEYTSTPEPEQPCDTETTEIPWRRWMQVDSYYDSAEGDKSPKVIVPCSSSLPVFFAVVPAISPLIAAVVFAAAAL